MNSLKINLELGSSIPIYEQIVDQVRDQLAIGLLKPGDQLPTVRQLASELRVNFNTIARAYRLLDDAGLISTQRGRGTYLVEHGEERTEDPARKPSIEEQLAKVIHSLEQQGYTPKDIDNTYRSIIKQESE